MNKFRNHGFVTKLKLPPIEEGQEKAKVVAAVWWKEMIQFLSAQAIFHQDYLKKRLNIITATWWSGCSEKMYDHPFHPIPNPRPTKNDFLPKTVAQIILVA